MNQEVEALVATINEKAITKHFNSGLVTGAIAVAATFAAGIVVGRAKEKRRILKDIKEKGEFSI